MSNLERLKKDLKKEKTLIMGILNLTPDSFFDGSKHNTKDAAIKHVDYMLENGLDILDIGGESTRPYSDLVSLEEERKRVIPILEEIRKRHKDLIISIDTNKTQIMKEAIDIGVEIINDVSALSWDENSKNVIKENDVLCVLMHSPHKPKDMQDVFSYKNGVVNDIINYFENRLKELTDFGINKDKFIIDPGIGFGKSIDDNFKIIKNLKKLKKFNLPVLLGASNKSYIFKTIGHENRYIGNIITEYLAIQSKMNIIRVHDVKSTKNTLEFVSQLSSVG